MNRVSKRWYYLFIAKDIALRSTCLKAKVGALIVNDDGVILSTGYNGPCRGSINCIEKDVCLKDVFGDSPYTTYDNCPAVHAEENAIINAARAGVSVKDSTLYFYYTNEKNKALEAEINLEGPCFRCRRMILNAGIKQVISPSNTWTAEKLLFKELQWYKNKIKAAKRNHY